MMNYKEASAPEAQALLQCHIRNIGTISTEVKDRLDDCLGNLSFAIRLHGGVLEPLTTEYAVLVEQILGLTPQEVVNKVLSNSPLDNGTNANIEAIKSSLIH
ncbi:MAG: hypothetical protein AB7E37_01505 [Candidatus Altimarinota bacterium]